MRPEALLTLVVADTDVVSFIVKSRRGGLDPRSAVASARSRPIACAHTVYWLPIMGGKK